MTDEQDIRREAAAMKAVQGLPGCLWARGMYAGIADRVRGGVTYYLMMPCAPTFSRPTGDAHAASRCKLWLLFICLQLSPVSPEAASS